MNFEQFRWTLSKTHNVAVFDFVKWLIHVDIFFEHFATDNGIQLFCDGFGFSITISNRIFGSYVSQVDEHDMYK